MVKPVLTRNETSTTTVTDSSASPVFPLPPNRTAVRTYVRANGELIRQISDAYKAAASPVTAKTPIQTFSEASERYASQPSVRRPGQTYQSIQRLKTGRPLAQGLPSPDSPPPIPLRSPLRGKAPPFPLNNNGRYPRVIAQNF